MTDIYPKYVEVAHKDAIDNILATKRQQGTLAVIILAAMAGLYSAATSTAKSIEAFELIALTFALALIGTGILGLFQSHIFRMRKRLDSIYKHYIPESDRPKLHLRKEGKLRWLQPNDSSLVYVSLIWLGAALVCYLSFRI